MFHFRCRHSLSTSKQNVVPILLSIIALAIFESSTFVTARSGETSHHVKGNSTSSSGVGYNEHDREKDDKWYYCELSKQPVLSLAKDPVTNAFYFVNEGRRMADMEYEIDNNIFMPKLKDKDEIEKKSKSEIYDAAAYELVRLCDCQTHDDQSTASQSFSLSKSLSPVFSPNTTQPADNGTVRQIHYCPLDFNECAIHTDDENVTFTCIRSPKFRITRTSWPFVIMIFYFMVVVCLSCSQSGHHTMGYCFSFCFPIYNQNLVLFNSNLSDHLLRRYIRRYIAQRARSGTVSNDDDAFLTIAGVLPSHLSLKTRIFCGKSNNSDAQNINLSSSDVLFTSTNSNSRHCDEVDQPPAIDTEVEIRRNSTIESNHSVTDRIRAEEFGNKCCTIRATRSNQDLVSGSNHDDNNETETSNRQPKTGGEDDEEVEEDNDNDDTTCIICFHGINVGDRVGDLSSCDHIFHVECLKSWLKQRNVCPLCLNENAAKPEYNNCNDNTNIHNSAEGDNNYFENTYRTSIVSENLYVSIP